MACKPFSALQFQRDDPPGSSGGADPTTWTGTTADGKINQYETLWCKFRFSVISSPASDDCLGEASFQVSLDGGSTWSEWATKKNALANTGGAGFGPWYLPGNGGGYTATPVGKAGTTLLRLVLDYAGSQHVSPTITMRVRPMWKESVAPAWTGTESQAPPPGNWIESQAPASTAVESQPPPTSTAVESEAPPTSTAVESEAP
jgi:hypothetical protein